MARQKNKKKVTRLVGILPILAVLIFAISYSALYAIGPSHLGDDIAYSYLARSAASGTFKEGAGNILSVRIMHIFPIAFFYVVFGTNVYSSVAYDAISFVLTVLLTYLIGSELYDRKVGVLAAFLIAIFPMVVIHSVTMSDNIPLMMFASLAIFAFLKGGKQKSRGWYVVCGIASCICGFIIPEGFIFWIIMGLLFLWKLWKDHLSIKNKSLYIVVGFAVFLCVMLIFNYVNSGSPLITFSANAAYYSQLYRPDIAPQPVGVSLRYYPGVMFPYKLKSGILSILTQAGEGWNKVGLFFYALVAAMAFLLFKRDRRAAILLVWFFVGLLYLQFGPMYVSIHPFTYVLSHRLDRYLTLLAPPLCIMVSAAVFGIIVNSKKKFRLMKTVILCTGLVILTITSFEVTVLWHQAMVDSQYTQLSIANYLSGLPNTTKIYFDSGYGDIGVYMDFNNTSRLYSDYAGITNCENISDGSYVVVPRLINDGFNYTPNPLKYCSYWIEELSPQVPYTNNEAVIPAMPFEANLYYVPTH